jgi:hypothetical protein
VTLVLRPVDLYGAGVYVDVAAVMAAASAAAAISISCFDLAVLHSIPSLGLEAHGRRVGRQDLRPSTILVTVSCETSFKALIMVVSPLILVALEFVLLTRRKRRRRRMAQT